MSREHLKLLISSAFISQKGMEAYGNFSSFMVQCISRAVPPTWTTHRRGALEDGVERSIKNVHEYDAVIIMGGPDIDPSLYGHDNECGDNASYNPEADKAQIAVVHEAIRTRTPLLGICRGLQIINVALGGTLHQNITVPGHLNPNVVHDRIFCEHSVEFVPGSTLSNVLSEYIGKPVCAAHHQAIDTLGEDLKVVAWAPDGIIEAVEHQNAPIFGVQWHPEAPQVESASLRALVDLLHQSVGCVTLQKK